MSELLAGGLFLPTVALALAAWAVPKVLSLFLGEGVKRLVIIGLLSTVIMFVLSGGFFAALYIWQGVAYEDFIGFGFWPNIQFFGRLGLSSALIWAPIMILSLAGLPRHWTKAVW